MVDAFDDFFTDRPATHVNGSKQIDQISVSRFLANYIDFAFILDPSHGAGDHSYIGIDLNLSSLTSRTNLCDLDPGHVQNRNLVSTDVKASQAHLAILLKMNDAQNIQFCFQELWQ